MGFTTFKEFVNSYTFFLLGLRWAGRKEITFHFLHLFSNCYVGFLAGRGRRNNAIFVVFF